jgi:hypothetical protein
LIAKGIAHHVPEIAAKAVTADFGLRMELGAAFSHAMPGFAEEGLAHVGLNFAIGFHGREFRTTI